MAASVALSSDFVVVVETERSLVVLASFGIQSIVAGMVLDMIVVVDTERSCCCYTWAVVRSLDMAVVNMPCVADLRGFEVEPLVGLAQHVNWESMAVG